jgi:hypothetical protein
MGTRRHLTKIKLNGSNEFIDAEVVPISAEIANYWHLHIQPYEQNEVSKKWNWPKLIWRASQIEQTLGRRVYPVAIVAKNQQNRVIPVALMLTANNYPYVWDSSTSSFKNGTWVWFIQKAPVEYLNQVGLGTITTLRNSIDAATVISMNIGTHGRLMLNSAPKGGEDLKNRYIKVMGGDALYQHKWWSTLLLKRRIGTLFAFNTHQAVLFLERNRRVFTNGCV